MPPDLAVDTDASQPDSSMLSSEALDSQPFPGLSLGFILIFYAPLVLAVLVFAIFTMFARRNPTRVARILTMVWLVACIPAGLMILMGYAFNPHGWNPVIQIALWAGVGGALIWIPVLLRAGIGRFLSS